MSDYIYTLESHLNADQNRVVAELQKAADAVSQNVYLAGGAMRDLLGGSPTRDLDFTLEGNPLKMAEGVAKRLGGKIVAQDDLRRVVEMVLPGGVTAQVAMARTERYSKPGGKPQVAPASIREDLLRRDFTVNAIALALNRGGKGLLIDPANGLADLQSRELRTTNSSAFFDDPSRLLRLVRLKHRLQFATAERTAGQVENALAENLHRLITKPVLLDELKRLGDEPSPSETVKELETTGLLALFSKALAGAKINYAAMSKLEKLKKNLPLGTTGWVDGWRSFFIVLTENLSTREKTELQSNLGMKKDEVESCKRLQVNARKLENALKSAVLRKPSQIYNVLAPAAPDEILFVLYESSHRIVQDRIRNYIQKYLPLVQEIPEADFAAAGASAGMPKFEKARLAFISARLNARPKKAEPEIFVETAPLGPAPRGRPARL